MNHELEQRIRSAAKRLRERGAKEVYLFGSAVTGQLRDDSDVDLGVIGLPATLFFRAMAEATRIVGRPVDLLALDRGDDIANSLLRSGELQRVG
ncbi:MAG TPA: nucleotidyltransferase domain-containing protein [Planctomycetota bacterium]|nr:nucleotidyltransferase domain-containing protein [Planctomycetota bacterium]